MSAQETGVSEAVRRLRVALGESQQAFAYRMRSAVRTIARYETVRPPKGKVLGVLHDLASRENLPDIAKVFSHALSKEVGRSLAVGRFDLEDDEERLVAVFVQVLRNTHVPKVRKPVASIIRALIAAHRALENRRDEGGISFDSRLATSAEDFQDAVDHVMKDLEAHR